MIAMSEESMLEQIDDLKDFRWRLMYNMGVKAKQSNISVDVQCQESQTNGFNALYLQFVTERTKEMIQGLGRVLLPRNKWKLKKILENQLRKAATLDEMLPPWNNHSVIHSRLKVRATTWARWILALDAVGLPASNHASIVEMLARPDKINWNEVLNLLTANDNNRLTQTIRTH